MAGKTPRPAAKKTPAKRHTLSRAANEEPDGEWRQWFKEIERRRKELADPKRKAFVVSHFDKEGESGTVARRRADPKKLAAFIKRDAKKTGRSLNVDLMLIHSIWKHAVGQEIANESNVFAFKNGVLTVEIHSSSLLQEIRQFHQEAILRDLRDIWQASMPLVRVVYRLGKTGNGEAAKNG